MWPILEGVDFLGVPGRETRAPQGLMGPKSYNKDLKVRLTILARVNISCQSKPGEIR